MFFCFHLFFLYSSTPPHPGPEENVVELGRFERVLFFYDRADKISLFLLKKTQFLLEASLHVHETCVSEFSD